MTRDGRVWAQCLDSDYEIPASCFDEEVLPWVCDALQRFDQEGFAPEVQAAVVTHARADWGPFERLAPFQQDAELLEEWQATTPVGDVAHLWEQSGQSAFIEGPERPRAWLMDVKDRDGWTLWRGAVDDYDGVIPKSLFYEQVLPLAVKRLELADQQREDSWHRSFDAGEDLGWG